MYESVSTLIIPFIALCILSVMVDRITLMLEEVMRKISWLPNQFWGPVAYAIVFAAGFLVCWRGSFDFFTNLNFSFHHPWEGWILTAILLSGGSAFVKSSFGMINNIPQAVSSVCSTIGGFFNGDQSGSSNPANSETVEQVAPEPTVQEGETL